VRKIKQAIAENREETVVIKNYRKNGTAFWNRLHIAPIYDDNGTATLFVGVLSEVSRCCTFCPLLYESILMTLISDGSTPPCSLLYDGIYRSGHRSPQLADSEGYNSATSSGCGSTSSGSLRPKSSSASGSHNDTPSECDGSNDGTNDGTTDSHEEDFATTDKGGSVFSAPSTSAATSFGTNSSTHSSYSSSSNGDDGCGGSVSSRCSGSSSGDAIKSYSGGSGTGARSVTDKSPGNKAFV
jgi:PAS domain